MSRAYLELLTNSRAKAYRRCKRLHLLQYGEGYRSVVVDEPLRFGSLLHVGLEAWWRQQLPLPPVVASGDWMHPFPAPWTWPLIAAIGALRANPHPDPWRQIVLEELLYGYALRWGNDGLQALAVESTFYAPLIDPATGEPSPAWDLGGKLDVIAQRDDGVVIVEHKSSAEDLGVGSNYWKRLRMDSQVSIYTDGAVALGYDPVATVYDVIAKPRLQRLEATPEADRKYTQEKTVKGVLQPSRLHANQRADDETPAEYRARLRELLTSAEGQARFYVRQDIGRGDALMAQHRADLWAQAQEMLTPAAYRNTDACVLYGRACAFFEPCSTGNWSALEDRTRFVRLTDPHVELVCAVDD